VATPSGLAFVRAICGVALALVASATLACSFSHSSTSLSDSSNDSSDSSVNSSESSRSSSGEKKAEENARFDRDVEQYTVAFLESGGTRDESFFSGIGELARQHGISDWESESTTWEAIGRGLARSPASPAERVAYQSTWSGGDAQRQSAVAKGLATAP
jgi:hypothetical protein